MKIAIVGATGLVGRKIMQIMEERGIQPDRLLPVASERSVGIDVTFNNQNIGVISMEEAMAEKPDFALFSAGGETSKTWAPKFAENGTVVIDNSSAWRMDPSVPLVVPEINAHSLKHHKNIIANPNCSTIQMVLALKPLHDAYGLKRLVISTYQSVTGTGKAAVDQLRHERAGTECLRAYPYQIDLNCLPHCDVFMDNDYTKEEMKLVEESRKILEHPDLRVTATAVRVPVVGGHAESINAEFNQDFSIQEVREKLSSMPGVVLMDNPGSEEYPMPFYQSEKDEVFVGRLRKDEGNPNTLNMWVVADNLRKGAATNAVQILQSLL